MGFDGLEWEDRRALEALKVEISLKTGKLNSLHVCF